jgi:hypothetical protein
MNGASSTPAPGWSVPSRRCASALVEPTLKPRDGAPRQHCDLMLDGVGLGHVTGPGHIAGIDHSA